MIFGLAEQWRKELKTLPTCDSINVSHITLSDTRASVDVASVEKALLAKNTLAKWSISVVYVTDVKDLPDLLQNPPNRLLGIDIETYALTEYRDDEEAGLQPRKSGIRLVQVYDGDKTVYVFDILKLGGLQALGKIIWDKPMVAHNAMFELKHLWHKRVCPRQLGCTLLADRVLNGARKDLREDLGLSKSAGLKELAKELLGIDISKEEQTSDWTKELSEEQIAYAALDAVLPIKLVSIQRPQLLQMGLFAAYKLLRDSQYPVAAMELCGIGFDISAHERVIEEWHVRRDELYAEIIDLIGRDLNLNSGKQVDEWLKEALKQPELDAWAKTPGGQLSTSTHLFKLHEHMHDVFPLIVEYKHLSKRINSFGKGLYKFVDKEKSRLYGSFSLGTTATGRMASQKPNMQQMPRGSFRSLFIAQEGHVLIGLDYSQQELRVAALVTKDEELLRIYAEGLDAHVITAARILKLPLNEVKKEHRQLAKALNFGLLYGQGAMNFAGYAKRNYGVEMSIEEAEKHRAAFFKIYRGLRSWQQQTARMTEVTKKIRTPGGRIRDFSREQKGYSYNATLNLPIQGAAAEITLHALLRIAPLLNRDVRLVNVVHDEILLEVIECKANEYAEKAKHAMELAFLDVFPEAGAYLSGLIDAKIGMTWADLK